MFLTRRFYLVITFIVLLFLAGYKFDWCYVAAIAATALLIMAVLVEAIMLYHKRGVEASRLCAERFSNGDENKVEIRVESQFKFPLSLKVIDEIPFVFQRRDVNFKLSLVVCMDLERFVCLPLLSLASSSVVSPAASPKK